MKLLLIFLLIITAIAGEDYYKILGIKRDADQQAIKKAFKKLTLKYHPDKWKGDKKQAEQKYSKIANAYDVLSDPQKKQIYDKYGQQGLKQGGGRGGGHPFHGMNHQHIFKTFFSEGGGFNFGGGRQKREQPPPQLFKQSDVIPLNFGNINQLFRRNQIWMVAFYNPKCKPCQKLQQDWIELANKLYGIIKVAAVNCLQEQELCEQYDIARHPTIIYFPENTAAKEEVYKGEKIYKDLSDFAVGKMQSFVRLVKTDKAEEFFESELPKVILFTDKKSTPPLLKAISKQFKDRVLVGEVRQTDPLVQEFQVSEFPSMMSFSSRQSFEKYQGQFNRERLQVWIRKYLNNYKPPKILKQYTKTLQSRGKCGKTDSNLCVFVFDQEKGLLKQEVQKVVNAFGKDAIEFYWIDSLKYPGKLPYPLGVYRGKRSKLAQLKCLDMSCIENSLSDILTGGGTFEPFTLPQMNSHTDLQNQI